MLKQIKLKDFLFFKDSEVNFGTGINVVLGGNDTGKTSLLKISNCLLNSVRRQPNTGSEIKYTIYTNYFSAYYRLNFPPVFEPKLKNKKTDFSYEVYTENFAMEHITEIPSNLNSIKAATSVEKKSVFFPNKELLTYIPWFFGLDIDTYP
jgi:AAA15 family ATPase/GTPase